jgi:hypothetical protein
VAFLFDPARVAFVDRGDSFGSVVTVQEHDVEPLHGSVLVQGREAVASDHLRRRHHAPTRGVRK